MKINAAIRKQILALLMNNLEDSIREQLLILPLINDTTRANEESKHPIELWKVSGPEYPSDPGSVGYQEWQAIKRAVAAWVDKVLGASQIKEQHLFREE